MNVYGIPSTIYGTRIRMIIHSYIRIPYGIRYIRDIHKNTHMYLAMASICLNQTRQTSDYVKYSIKIQNLKRNSLITTFTVHSTHFILHVFPVCAFFVLQSNCQFKWYLNPVKRQKIMIDRSIYGNNTYNRQLK